MSTQPPLVVLIEDDPDHAEIIRDSFHREEIPSRLVCLTDGQAATKYFFGNGEKPEVSELPALILVDLKLPKVNGLTLVKQLKADKRLTTIPVVVLTTSETQQDVQQAYHAGANSYLVKPFDFKKFSSMLKKTETYWLKLNRPNRSD